ncbi:asparagine synthase (glutamine-hydrolyzing) [Fictibacillus barbaricus]|uniref:asparagine synthase (glutamine-hydrolyzing) n=1 Tax=Fictibacillus barbaricus TaxID=182136 RepID=A0ABU1U3Z4_9BACL|nr:asparagine synthase (glutamine-hydrolyzing) [Fictibacillus barbaricus]MDR7074214.1 asparagine synthase (glutamine-hydrolyzing) [Fictibacillus barbaricus]
MCRIFGYIGPEKVADCVLREVSNLQLAGGPDQQSFKHGTGWAIGNNRLSIVDLDNGEQPYELGEHISVVFNGEIYNHEALRGELEQKGYAFDDHCDGSILPAMYFEYGKDFVRYLDGMFAIAVVDTRNESHTLLLATDPIGIKSLYYYWDETKRAFYFSSELPSLLGFENIPKNLWLQGIDSYLTTKAIFGERTMFEGIYTIPASSLLEIRPGTCPEISKWKTYLTATKPIEGFEASSQSLLSYLTNEVNELLKADVPISTLNSGGLDSSLITAIASKHKKGIHSFNIAYEGDWPFDEKAFAREVAEKNGTIHHQVIIDPKEFQNIIPQVVKQLGQPNADPITLSTYSLFEAINQAGFKVAVSGDGADEMFGGYDRYKEAMSCMGDWIRPYVDSLGAINQSSRESLYSNDYKAYLNEKGRMGKAIEEKLRREKGNRLDTILEFERSYRLPNYHLRRVDHLSMAHSVEVRVPFCQPRIVDFASQLTDDERIKGEQVKRILYRSAEGLLPHSVLHRKKQPFTLPINAMMRPGLPLFTFIQEVLDHDTIRNQNLFNVETIDLLMHQQAHQPSDKTALALWSVMMFQLWSAQFGVSIGSHSAKEEVLI